MSRFAIAGLQLEAINGNNVESMLREIDTAKRRFPWIDMLVLGELNALGSKPTTAEPLPSVTEERFREAAERNSVWLIPGTLYERVGTQVYNTATVIGPKGEIVGRYRKIYPFLPYEQGVAGGDRCFVFDVPGIGRLGVSICYDMWFPETTRTLAWLGAEAIVHVSLTNTIDRDVEVSMARATAAINQCYFLSVNVGAPLGYGESCMVGPGGELIHRAGKGREIMPIDVDFEYVRHVRRNGWHGLGQPLKSFRDGSVQFPPYVQGAGSSPELGALGPLVMPTSLRPNR